MPSVNQYFNNRVTSIAFKTISQPATVGVMSVGEYEFGTKEFETIQVISGALTVKLPDADDWQTFEVGEQFSIEANKTFDVKVDADAAYLCTYGESA
ncbi:pyrimidine/purine nucleoside phosphorylase [Psychrobacter aestuarii]|uniref:Pyrimidine/purine nucleoside phosphorylase n=1 Tax=Psychrobacter aestuarii TaxID=556327 RepID=A0ABP3FDI4_9GAMM|nr:pyrimidine/purine nucleoside phosphorylase [Psychrobacter aestuarii]